MKIGLFFGSFNPIHTGHLIIAQTIINESDLDKIWFVVSPQNPFKERANLLHEFDRLDLVRLAIEDTPFLEASDIEFSMPKPSYTVDTLVYLKEKYPSYNFKLIMGEDNLTHFHKWKNYEVILDQFKVIAYPRPGCKQTQFHSHPQVQLVQSSITDISATYIRNCIKEEKSIQYLVPDAVKEKIAAKKYFKE